MRDRKATLQEKLVAATDDEIKYHKKLKKDLALATQTVVELKGRRDSLIDKFNLLSGARGTGLYKYTNLIAQEAEKMDFLQFQYARMHDLLLNFGKHLSDAYLAFRDKEHDQGSHLQVVSADKDRLITQIEQNQNYLQQLID